MNIFRFPEKNQDVNKSYNKNEVQGQVVETDDIKDEFEYYMTIGLNSTVDSNNLQRNKQSMDECHFLLYRNKAHSFSQHTTDCEYKIYI